ncbi:MAG: RsmB/NOP family class I SAM-dependent RNA methyltransferase [Patescibacteria group bacterium]
MNDQPQIQELPTDFLKRLQLMYGSDSVKITNCFAKPRATTFRVNTLKADASLVEKELSDGGFVTEKYLPIANSYILRNKGLRDLTETATYQTGKIYVQGLSSMIPPLVLGPAPGDQVLDIAAAPGSKTTQMAALMNNQGLILANDASRVRLYKLRSNLETQGATNVQVRQGMGQLLWRDFSGVFDKALVDVPCSMEGRFNMLKPKTIADWSVFKVKRLVDRQRLLLRTALSCLRSGGELVYSTCTLSPEENEGVIDWLVRREKNRVEVVEIEQFQDVFSSPIMEWQNKQYSSEVGKTRRILPSDVLEGFFIAKLRKL